MDSNPGISLLQPGGINIESPLQNQEEDEDIEEQKRRQQEIQNFLTTAMDEFNYDDQSTINSSTNVSIDDTYNNRSNVLKEKYRNADLDDQLKVLYEIRVREVRSLTEQLENLKAEVDKQTKVNGQTTMLLEAEKDKAKISMQQAQILLVSKTEEISKLKNEIDLLRATVLSLETTVKAINDEYTLCKQSNKELIEQLSLMHNGLTTNTISDRQLQEQHHSEVNQLHHLLDSANMKLHRKEKEYKQLEQKLKEGAIDKEVIISEKANIINQLSQNLENAQLRCQEFADIIDKVSQENKTLKLSATNDLVDSIRNVGLGEKTEIIKALQKQLDKANEIQKAQKTDIELLQDKCEKLSADCKKYELSKGAYEKELDSWKQKHSILNDDFVKSSEELKNFKLQLEEQRSTASTECQIYENKIKLLQNALQNYENKENLDQSVQASGFSESLLVEKEENHKLKNHIDNLNGEITNLNKKLCETEAQLSQMKLTVSLETERENLIKTLQDKAAKFEAIIKQKQKKTGCSSIGTNTDSNLLATSSNEDLLRTKYETDLVQKEIQIRTEVKKDFDVKLGKIQNELSKRLHQFQGRQCENCIGLANNVEQMKILTGDRDEEIARLKFQMKQDREAVATLLTEWGDKFVKMENEKDELTVQNNKIKAGYDNLLLKMKTREVGDSKLYEVIKRECEETIKMWNKNTIENMRQYTISHQKKIAESNRRIEEFSKTIDKEVHAIETQYLKRKESLQHRSKHKT